MKIVEGKYTSAKIFTDNVEQSAVDQIQTLCNQDFVVDCSVRIMPDVHSGAGCVIGFTANLGDKIIPNLVGVDISCGLLVTELGNVDVDLEKLDKIINSRIPAGMNVHKTIQVDFLNRLKQLRCFSSLKNIDWIEKSIGTLGGGNHFIELNQFRDEAKYLVIHSGSRNLGKQVAEIYQNIAIQECCSIDIIAEQEDIIRRNKENGTTRLIQTQLADLKKRATPKYDGNLCFLTGQSRENYLYDMQICQEYATLNRQMMSNIITAELFGQSEFTSWTTTHNYIDFQDNIIRKGAVSAKAGERLIIPINMRDGSIIAVGKGNLDWNCSAPHGAGRLMSRNEARKCISMDEYTQSMDNVYTTSVCKDTLDEAPMAYKPMHEIIQNIQATVDIEKVIYPIYNFKAKG